MRNDDRNYGGSVLVAVANPMVRRALMDALRQSGARDVIYTTDWNTLAETLGTKSISVLIVDDNLSEKSTGELVKNIRQGEVHAHPFPVVVVLTQSQETQQIRALIDTGPDAILLTPLAIGDLFAKLDHFKVKRKPFAVTREYIGPDRREGVREGAMPPLIVEAPNPLAKGGDEEAFQRALKEGQSSLNTAKMKCTLGQLAWAMRSGKTSDFVELIPAVDYLAEAVTSPKVKMIASGLAAALRTEVQSDIVDWCRKLLTVAGNGK